MKTEDFLPGNKINDVILSMVSPMISPGAPMVMVQSYQRIYSSGTLSRCCEMVADNAQSRLPVAISNYLMQNSWQRKRGGLELVGDGSNRTFGGRNPKPFLLCSVNWFQPVVVVTCMCTCSVFWAEKVRCEYICMHNIYAYA